MNSTINAELLNCLECNGRAREIGGPYSDWVITCENYPRCPMGVLAVTRKEAQEAWTRLNKNSGV